MNDYKFLLTPYTSFVKGLCGTWSNDFSIDDESDSDLGQTDVHVLSSPHLNITSDTDELTSKLKGLLMLMDGALAVIYGFEEYKRYGPLSVYSSEGVNFSKIANFTTLNVTQINPFDSNNLQAPHAKATHFSLLINLASTHEPLRVILGMCALGNDWVNLYRLWETIREYTYDMFNNGSLQITNLKNKKHQRDKVVSMAFDINDKDIKRFTGTANSFEMLGYLARHGRGGTGGKIKNPMSRMDASLLVHKATNKFCLLFLNKI